MENIKEQRKSLGMTQKEFAEEMGINLRSLQRWEQGQNDTPEQVKRMVAYYVKMQTFLHEKGLETEFANWENGNASVKFLSEN